MKRKILAGALILICFSLVAYGTLAYFTAEEIAHNVITSGNIEIELLEWADEAKTEPFPENGITGVMPGTKAVKIVEVKNTGSSPAYIRVKVEKAITLDEPATTEIGADVGLLKIECDSENWKSNNDGFYYYNKALEPNNTTLPLFTSVEFDAKMGNEYQNSTASVTVKVYAVQSANNGTDALTATGWPAE